MNESKIKTIIDHIGRLVIGVEIEESTDESVLTLDNPVVIHVQPGQNNQLQVQSFPYVFMEFIAASSRDKNRWHFKRCNIVESDIQLDDRIIMQYRGINSSVTAQPQSEPEVIKLFSDD